MIKTEINKEDIIKLDLFQFTGDIKVVNEEKELSEILLMLNDESIIGFDTEHKPSFKKGIKNPTALIQLATKEQVFLIRIIKTGISSALIDLLNNTKILKVGLGLHDDLKFLGNGLTQASFIDLNTYCSKVGFNNIGVRNLAAMVLGVRISKRQQLSNWEAEVLSKPQQLYAATDAWICREIYIKLKQEGY